MKITYHEREGYLMSDGDIIVDFFLADADEEKYFARLFCAAPDLLAACEAVQRAETLAGVDTPAFEDAFMEACKLVDAALAKARGQ